MSKTVSHALRHEPWLYELELDNDGWAGVDSLLAALHQECPAWRDLSETDLTAMIEASSKKRHEITNGRIRALYGHSLPGKLRRKAAAPPARLFHGTAPATLPAIRKDGLLPMQRQYVHLSTDRETAQGVGKRKASEPVILSVKAQEAHQAGVVFYEGNDKVWLADRVPPEFIEMTSYRPLGDWERRIIVRLLSAAPFPGRDDLLAQVEKVSARTIDDDGSVSLKSAVVRRAAVTTRIPVEGEAQDTDGVTIHYLLHVVDGEINELEVYKDDSSRVRVQACPENLAVMNAG